MLPVNVVIKELVKINIKNKNIFVFLDEKVIGQNYEQNKHIIIVMVTFEQNRKGVILGIYCTKNKELKLKNNTQLKILLVLILKGLILMLKQIFLQI